MPKSQEVENFVARLMAEADEFLKAHYSNVHVSEFRCYPKVEGSWDSSENEAKYKEMRDAAYELEEDNSCATFEVQETSVWKFVHDTMDAEDEVENLLLDLLKLAGVKKDEAIKFYNQVEWGVDEFRTVPSTGMAAYANFDDFSVAFYRDGKPLVGMYVSSRGSLYQAGGYMHATGKHFYGHNFGTEDVGVWEPAGADSDSSIARQYLLHVNAVTDKGEKVTEVPA